MTNDKIIIKASLGDNYLYYVSHYYDNIKLTLNFTDTLNKAKIFNNYEEAKKIIQEVNNQSLELFYICSLCQREYKEYPAISRTDNKTKICPMCGRKEALSAWLNSKKTTNY